MSAQSEREKQKCRVTGRATPKVTARPKPAQGFVLVSKAPDHDKGTKRLLVKNREGQEKSFPKEGEIRASKKQNTMWAHQKRKLRKEQRSEVELSNKFSFQHDKEEMVWKKLESSRCGKQEKIENCLLREVSSLEENMRIKFEKDTRKQTSG
ncbi:hypothetical protein LguiB_028276 [Lonicera macranthoides]